MRAFWKHGYEGTTLPELEAAMGINRPSMYAAFGNKESLFRKALDRYVERNEAIVREALAEPTARRAIERLLKSAVSGCDKSEMRGCMLVQGALSCGEAAESIQRELTARRSTLEQAIRDRFTRGIKDGDLPPDTDAAALAKYVSTVQQGNSVQASAGATRSQLLATIDIALRAIPE